MKVVAIIGTYNPQQNKFMECYNSLKDQVDKVIVTDNSEQISDFISNIGEIVYIKNHNQGIAKAQNKAIKKAQQINADFIVFSDQDSIFEKKYVSGLIDLYSKIGDKKFAAITPFIIDEKSNQQILFVKRWTIFKIKFDMPNNDTEFFDVYEAINSGFFVKVSCFKDIGLFREELFLDWVDFEWCWRAKQKKFNIYGTKNAKLIHELGQKKKFFMGKSFTLNHDYRYYYIIRNGIFLSLKSDFNIFLKLNIFFNTLKYLIGFLLFSNNKFDLYKLLLLAISNGIKGKMGKMQ